MNHLIIRVDANKEVALGHLKRCISLSSEILHHRMIPLFICGYNDCAKDLLSGFDVMWTSTEIGSTEDAKIVINAAFKKNIEVILIDSYFISEQYLRKLSDSNLKVIIFEDFAKDYENVFAVINGSLLSDHTYSCPHQLLGLDYIVLAPCYKNYVYENRVDIIRNIVITVGGIDHFNLVPWTINVLNKISENLEIFPELDVVVGPYFDNTSKILEEKRRSRLRVNIHQSPKVLFNLFKKADIAITGGGGTVYELLRMGIPAVAVGLSEQQNLILSSISKFEVIESVLSENGQIGSKQLIEIKDKIIRVISNKYLRNNLSRAGASIVDGRGAERVSQFLGSLVGFIDE